MQKKKFLVSGISITVFFVFFFSILVGGPQTEINFNLQYLLTGGGTPLLSKNGARDETSKNRSSDLDNFIASQEQYKNDIKNYCKSNKVLPSRIKSSSLIYDEVNKLTYCSVYKVASTSWGTTLLILRGKYDPNDGVRFRVKESRAFKKLSMSNALKVSKTTTRFMVARNPFERIISAYRNKFAEGQPYYYYNLYGEKMVEQYRPVPKELSKTQLKKMLSSVKTYIRNKGKSSKNSLAGNPYAEPVGPTFLEFVKYVVDKSHPNDPHWEPIYLCCLMCYMEYDFILRFENLTVESNLFLEYLGKLDVTSARWENPTATGVTNSGLTCEYFGQLNSDLIEKLYEKYEYDFKIFNYSPEEYRNCVGGSPGLR